MAKRTTAFEDRKGNLHKTAEAATKADLAGVLGRIGEGGGLSDGLAQLIIDKRHELEAVFVEHDEIAAGEAEAA